MLFVFVSHVFSYVAERFDAEKWVTAQIIIKLNDTHKCVSRSWLVVDRVQKKNVAGFYFISGKIFVFCILLYLSWGCSNLDLWKIALFFFSVSVSGCWAQAYFSGQWISRSKSLHRSPSSETKSRSRKQHKHKDYIWSYYKFGKWSRRISSKCLKTLIYEWVSLWDAWWILWGRRWLSNVNAFSDDWTCLHYNVRFILALIIYCGVN